MFSMMQSLAINVVVFLCSPRLIFRLFQTCLEHLVVLPELQDFLFLGREADVLRHTVDVAGRRRRLVDGHGSIGELVRGEIGRCCCRSRLSRNSTVRILRLDFLIESRNAVHGVRMQMSTRYKPLTCQCIQRFVYVGISKFEIIGGQNVKKRLIW